MQTIRQLRRLRHAPGQTLVLFALMSLVLIAGLGLVIDSGINYTERRTMQNAADTAALAGTRVIARQATTSISVNRNDVWNALFNTAVANGAPNDASRFTCDFIDNARNALNQPCNNNGSIPTTATGIRVRVSEQHTTFFMRALGIKTSGTAAVSTAQVQLVPQIGEFDVVFMVCGINSPGEANSSIMQGMDVSDNTVPDPPPPTPAPPKPIITVVQEPAQIRDGAYAYDWNVRSNDGSLKPNASAPDFLISSPTMPDSAKCGLTGNYNYDWHGLMKPAGSYPERDVQYVATNGQKGYDIDQYIPAIKANTGTLASTAGPAHTINGTQGCLAGQNPNNCVMLLPIVVPHDPYAYSDYSGSKAKRPSPELDGRLWGAFLVTKSGNDYRGKLIKNYPIHANGANLWSTSYPNSLRPYSGPISINLVK